MILFSLALAAAVQSAPAKTPPGRRDAPGQAPQPQAARKMSYKDKHALETLPARMEALQAEVDDYIARHAGERQQVGRRQLERAAQ